VSASIVIEVSLDKYIKVLKMKVFFLTEGGSNIGFGHITRCTAIQQAFKQKGVVSEILVNADETVENVLGDLTHRRLNWLVERKELFSLIEGADLVIIDSYLAAAEIYQEISARIKRGVYLDDIKRIDYPRGTVINSAIYAKDINYPKKEGVNYLLGTEYIALRREFWKLNQEQIKKDIKQVLVTFGGMDHSDLITRLSSYLGKKFDFNFRCIDKKNRVDSGEFVKIILESDICISAGGQTTYELARCGIAAIGVCLADNQLRNLKKWQEVGFLDFAGWYSDADLFEKIETFLKSTDFEKRNSRSRIGKKYIDGQGALRIVDRVLG